MTTPEHITIVGAGLMGHGIAQVFAVHGHPVWLVELNEVIRNSAKDRVRNNLTNMANQGIEFNDDIDEILDRIRMSAELAPACESCDFLIEAVYENLDLKQQIFADLDRLCPPTAILCSNTSVMSITEIASKSVHRERIVGTHFWNPPYLIPLVEVIRAEETADWCTVPGIRRHDPRRIPNEMRQRSPAAPVRF